MRLRNLFNVILLAIIFPFPAKAETLLDLEKELLKNSPAIQAAQNRQLSAQQVPIQEGTLPDPIVSFTDFGVGHPFSTLNNSDFAYRGLGFSQDLPFPGK